MRLWVLADDLTGANDTAVQFARAGLSAATLLARDPAPWKGAYDILALTTESRGISEGAARVRCREAVARIAPAPGEVVYKKVDSALRGNPGAEIEGVLQALGPAAVAVVAPAFPANGRTTMDGRQLIYGVPVDQTEMAADPLAPVRESHVPALLRAQADLDVAHVALAEVERGPERLRQRLEELRGAGARIVVVDAATELHLEVVAAALLAVEGAVPCGSAGLGAAIARRLRPGVTPGAREGRAAGEGRDESAAQRRGPDEAGEEGSAWGPLLGVIGSKSEGARAQVETARRLLPEAAWVALPPAALARRDAAVLDEAVNRAARSLRDGRDAVLYVERGEEADPRAIAAGLGELAARAVGQASPGALYLTGGDTARSAFDRLGVEVFEVRAELAPGVCAGRARGGAASGLEVITKAGSFGDASTLYRLMTGRKGGKRPGSGPGEESPAAERN